MAKHAEKFLIGIDTGGTYTDAVVIDQMRHRILASAKALTTKGDLAIGVGEAMAAAVAKLDHSLDTARIGLVSISTTLATNAVVEGHGGAVAAILIGFDDGMLARTGIAAAFPDLPLVRVGGGHNHNGEEATPLDEDALRSALKALHNKVGAFAIASTFAVRNPAHEARVRDIVSELTGCPVTLSSELSSALDAPRRALTAVLNARLIAHVSRLIAAVRRAMHGLAIDCPLMIMKGDGSLAAADSVAARPIETVLSGPAASLVGAKWLSGLDSFVMSDMGGTTTDVGILEHGRPRIASDGAEVGGWRTMVKAIDVRTVGLGGDSEVAIGVNGRLEVGPQRAVPLSLLANRFPEVNAMLDADLAESEGGSMLGRFVLRPFGDGGEAAPAGLATRDAELLAQIGDRPVPLRQLAVSSAAQRALASLRKRGLVQVSGFTPSDAAHVLDLQANWQRRAAEQGARLWCRLRDMKMPDAESLQAFCRDVWSLAVTKSCRIIADTVLGDVKDSETLIDAVCSGRGRIGLARVVIAPEMPIVAVGGPVKVYYDEVARRLGTEAVFAPFCDVANAVGAASAMVADRVTVTVEGDGNGIFRIHGAGHSEVLSSGKLALERAKAKAAESALAAAVQRGAEDPKVTIAYELALLPEARDEDGLLTATVTAEAIGRPAS